MRYKNKSLKLMFLVFSIFSIICVAATYLFAMGKITGDKRMKNPLMFTIEPMKKRVNFNEALIIRCSLKNISDKEIYINKVFYITGSEVENKGYGVALEIISEKHEKIDFKIFYEMKGLSQDFFIELNPNKSFSDDTRITIQEFFKEKGKFQITAYYYNFRGEEFSLPNIWKGVLKSNTIEINVLEGNRDQILTFDKTKFKMEVN